VIVAGGGGGSDNGDSYAGGKGGGHDGTDGTRIANDGVFVQEPVKAGTQSYGTLFQGANASCVYDCGGGGGGYRGGDAVTNGGEYIASGAGGSGYIGGVTSGTAPDGSTLAQGTTYAVNWVGHGQAVIRFRYN
jgi:hypothetical protein